MRCLYNIKVELTAGLLLFCMFLSSCFDDKGNYDYIKLDEIMIDTSGKGIQATYSVNQFEKLSIPVKVSQMGKDTSNLRCEWTVFSDNQGVDNKTKPQLLSSKPEFNEEIGLKPGSYILLFSVTDKTSGVKEEVKFGLNVSALLKSGWLVAYEDAEGMTDVAIINDKVLAPSVTTDQVILDMFSKVNGRKLNGSALQLSHVRMQIYPPYPPAIYILTDGESVRVNDQDFSLFGKVSEWFFVKPAIDKFQVHVLSGYGSEFIVNDGKIHYNDMGVFAQADQKKFPVEVIGKYYAEPWLVTKNSSNVTTVFYDRLSQKFRTLSGYPVKLTDLSEQSGSPAFDCRNVGMDMLYLESGFDGITLAVMEASDHKRYLLECDFNNLSGIARGKYLFSGYPGTDQAKYFSFGNKGKVFMYATDKEVYAFDYASVTPSVSADPWKAPENEMITCMKLFRSIPLVSIAGRFPYNPNSSYILGMESKLIFIATYNEKTGEGFVYRYNINESNGVIDRSSEVKYRGFGKVTAMGHKLPNNNNG